jgi:hypothetical protein
MADTRPAPPFADPNFAREASAKAAEARAAKAALPAEERALRKLETAADQLTGALLDAALGRGSFAALSPADRLKATIKALEYSVGRPSPQGKAAEDTKDVPTADKLFG